MMKNTFDTAVAGYYKVVVKDKNVISRTKCKNAIKKTNKLIYSSELELYISQGFIKGKSQKHPNRDYSAYTRVKK